MRKSLYRTLGRIAGSLQLALLLGCLFCGAGWQARAADVKPAPLLGQGQAAKWWFVFKLNAGKFPNCGSPEAVRSCPFGGKVQPYAFGQQFLYASDADSALRQGGSCVGDGADDPVGATFAQIYDGDYFYVVWNDQFYKDPPIAGCGDSCGSPWGHSKGILAWDAAGEGVVMQVSTPSWPGSGNHAYPRQHDGNTLGCVDDNDVKASQHFFSLKLNSSDVVNVLDALTNASVVTDPGNPQIVHNGGPDEISRRVAALGRRSASATYTAVQLSSGVGLISKPSRLHVPPWQMVSAVLGGVPLRAATWWAVPKIYSTADPAAPGCWDGTLGMPGAVEVALNGAWQGIPIGLEGGPSPDRNHAKIGVSTGGVHALSIFGDMNQQGTRYGPKCESSQNGRGGVFFVVEDATLNADITALIHGGTAPTVAPK